MDSLMRAFKLWVFMKIRNGLLNAKSRTHKIASVVVGTLTAVSMMALIGKHLPLVFDGSGPCEHSFFFCYQFWFGAIGATFIILAWLYSIFMLVALRMPSLTQKKMYPKLVIFGHIGFAIALILAMIFTLVWMVNFLFGYCQQHNHEFETTTTPPPNATTTTTTEASGEARWGKKKKPQVKGGGGGVSIGISGCGKHVMYTELALLYILPAFLALIHAAVCGLVVVTTRREMRQPPPPAEGEGGAPSTQASVQPSTVPIEGREKPSESATGGEQSAEPTADPSTTSQKEKMDKDK